MKVVGLNGAVAAPAYDRLFRLLGEVFPVRFVKCEAAQFSDLDAFVIQSEGLAGPAMSSAAPVFHVVSSKQPKQNFESNVVQFSAAGFLPTTLRQRRLVTPEAADAITLDKCDGDVLATIEDKPIWVADGSRHFVSAPLPEIAESRQLSEFLNGESFLRLLPLYLFLRRLTDEGWQPPALRACMVVDDPNLRSQTYGRIDYRKLAVFAKERRFHVAMATVPLDAWQVSARAAEIFRAHPEQLSLLIHGNNHTRFELAQSTSEQQELSLLAEARRRADALQKKSGVEIQPVMAPPHGVCLESMLRAMLALGFAGVTTNRWSLWKFNDLAKQPASIGLRPADMLAGGLPVVNRFRFNSSIGENEAVIAALLGQPIIPYGHHQDFAEDMAAVTKSVECINSLGNVRWMNMGEILRTNFESRTQGDTLQVRMFSREVQVASESARQVQVLRTHDEQQQLTISAPGNPNIPAKFGDTVPVNAGRIKITSEPKAAVDYNSVNGQALSPLIPLRRFASEMRDRLFLK